MVDVRTLFFLLVFFVQTMPCWAFGGTSPTASGATIKRHHDYNTGYGRSLSSDQARFRPQSFRDANGNLVITNGRPAHWGGGVGGAFAGGGAAGGVGQAGGQISSIAAGNLLTVQVQGSNNIVIVDAEQENSGDVSSRIDISQ